jgi:hypothetical protein
MTQRLFGLQQALIPPIVPFQEVDPFRREGDDCEILFHFSLQEIRSHLVHNRLKQTTISAVEFIHRFLLNTLPQGFVRIRHYGSLANRQRTAHLSLIQRLLRVPCEVRTSTRSVQEIMLKLTRIDITLCPCCKKGGMQKIADILCYMGKHPYQLIRPPNG